MVGAGRRQQMIGVDLPARRPGVPLAGAAEAGDRAGAGRARTQVLVAGNWKRPRWRCSLTTLMVANRPSLSRRSQTRESVMITGGLLVL